MSGRQRYPVANNFRMHDTGDAELIAARKTDDPGRDLARSKGSEGGNRSAFFLLPKMLLFPLLFYFTGFSILTDPALRRFSTHLFADEGDGLQSLWNLWWVNRAVTVLHQSPWHTSYLHWPWGSSLLGHTLNPFNGFLAVVLLKFFTLVETYNFIVIFSYVIGGLTAFLLANQVTASYGPSLVAGYIFTFSNYHFAQTMGHLQMASLEWIPLFLLFWLRLILKPQVSAAMGAAIALLLVVLCDYYYFFYCVIAAVIIAGWHALRRRDPFFFLGREYRVPLGIFSVLAIATCGALTVSLVVLNHRDPLLGAHFPKENSLDLLSPFIYGGFWRFYPLTFRYWSHLPASTGETSVHLGFSVVALLLYVWRARKRIETPQVGLWFFILALFIVLALGPTPHIFGRQIARIALPYAWFQAVLPPLKMSGVPIRMMVMVFLSAGLLAAAGLKSLCRGGRGTRVAAGALLALLALEYWPRGLIMTRLSIPVYVTALKRLPGNDGVLDSVSNKFYTLFYQTVHEKPLAFGYLARVPRSVDQKDQALDDLLEENSFDLLWQDYRIRYVLSEEPPLALKDLRSARVVWRDGKVWIFDLAPGADSTG